MGNVNVLDTMKDAELRMLEEDTHFRVDTPDAAAMRDARKAVAELVEAANAALNQEQVELPGWLTQQLSSALAKVQP